MLGRVKTGKGAAYALLAPAFYGAGLACMLTPAESLTNVFLYAHGEDCITLWRMFGASLLMLPTWAVSLKVCAPHWPVSPAHLAGGGYFLRGELAGTGSPSRVRKFGRVVSLKGVCDTF